MFKEQQKDPIKQKTPQLELLKEEPTSSLFSRVFLDCGISPNYVFGFGHKLPVVEVVRNIARFRIQSNAVGLLSNIERNDCEGFLTQQGEV